MISPLKIDRTLSADQLTDRELDFALAEWVGWHLVAFTPGAWEWRDPFRDTCPQGPPEYSTSMYDVVALRRAIRDHGQQAEVAFAHALRKRMFDEFWLTGPGPDQDASVRVIFQMVDASPRQQSEAAYEAYVREHPAN